MIRARDTLGRSRRNEVPYATSWQSQTAAGRRLEAIDEWRRSQAFSRFVEVPPTLEPAEIPGMHSGAAAEEVMFKWQRERTELLLLARTSDAVLSVIADDARSGRRSFAELVELTQPVVSLTPLPRSLRRTNRGLFEWRVELRTSEPKYFQDRLRPFGHWLGIGVDVVRGSRVNTLSSCQQPGGLAGMIGGLLKDSEGRPVQLTCAHVAAPDCCSKLWRADLPPPPEGGVSDEPDAAALRSSTSCFQIPSTPPLEVRPASSADLAALTLGKIVVQRVGGRPRARGGRVIGVADPDVIGSPSTALYPNGLGGLSRFPAVTISPRRGLLARLMGPFGRRPFSVPGESGCWVIEPGARLWLGMLVSGDDESGVSYALTLAISRAICTAKLTSSIKEA